jgi:hypothetical protein
MRLAIVGNSDRPGGGAGDAFADWRRIGAFIDSADFVVRFNAIRNQTQAWTGRRTDRLYLRGQGSGGRLFARCGVPFYAIDKPRELVVVVDLRPYPRPNDDVYELVDYEEPIARRHSFATTFRLDQGVIAEAQRLVQAESCPLMPSLGFVALAHLLNDSSFTRHDKYLLGFTAEGWNGHPWAVEKRLIDRWLASGVLKRFV